ncbi:hypothetical protein Lbir_2065 [Legionella birminghamensis]|uniref:Uncharacterized protein n=1 Tax=Legionella birminghamensis TaxID=28083 RepID=A0A378I8P2_9GAMM|nr:hypothetical protein Lbir_2065 [Legionella birminghamensis]STX31588.1 Uncharacterised protein [Legionella birminghamensis]
MVILWGSVRTREASIDVEEDEANLSNITDARCDRIRRSIAEDGLCKRSTNSLTVFGGSKAFFIINSFFSDFQPNVIDSKGNILFVLLPSLGTP